jgi:hypothetical protein
MGQQCSAAGCDKAAAGFLDTRGFCREHLIATCYARIEECAQRITSKEGLSETLTPVMGRNLAEIADQATKLSLSAEDLTNLERAQLMDIVLSVAHLSSRLRRSPRKLAAVPVRLCYEGPGAVWEEETATQELSRHGALLSCHHPVEGGMQLTLVRKDTGERAQARVAWRGPRKNGSQDLGLEILGHENFWGRKW